MAGEIKSQNAEWRDSFKQPCVAVIQKPFDMGEIMARVPLPLVGRLGMLGVPMRI